MFLRLGRHPHLAALLGVTADPDGSTCMLVEFAPCGSLDKVLGEAAERGETPSAAVRESERERERERESVCVCECLCVCCLSTRIPNAGADLRCVCVRERERECVCVCVCECGCVCEWQVRITIAMQMCEAMVWNPKPQTLNTNTKY